MMNKTTYTSIAFALALAASCVSNQSVTDIVEIAQSEETLDISSLTDSMRVVKLSSSVPEAIVNRIDRVLSMNGRIYIVDRSSNKLLCFDNNGNFISSTKSIIGHGSMEYVRLMDASVDPNNSMVYVCCDAPYKIIKLDADLNAIDAFSFDDMFDEISIAGDCLYAMHESDDSFELRQYNIKDLNGKYKKVLKNDDIIHGVRSIGKSMSSDGRCCRVALPFSNHVCSIRNGNIESETVIDFGSFWFDYERSKGLGTNKFLGVNRDKDWIIMNTVVSDSLILFNTNQAGIANVHANGQASTTCDVINSGFPFSSSLIYPLGGVYGAAVMVAENAHIARYKRICKEKGIDLSDDSSTLNKWVRDYAPTDNPILVIEYLKGRKGSRR